MPIATAKKKPAAEVEKPAEEAAPAKKKEFEGRGGWKPPQRKPTGRPPGRPRKSEASPEDPATAKKAKEKKPAATSKKESGSSSAAGWYVLGGLLTLCGAIAGGLYLAKRKDVTP